MKIREEIKQRILMLDGALGTIIQSFKLEEDDYRGDRFKAFSREMKGCNDVLVLTLPDIIKDIHKDYLNAGSDIICTNSFNANAISLSEYALEGEVYEINKRSAELARDAITELGFTDRFVAGSIGPTGRSASISPRVEDPAERNITFKELETAYREQIIGLIDGGVDLILLETVFDTLNAKAAIYAHEEICDERDIDIPLMISGTVSDNSGRLLAGQTVEAFVYSIQHSKHLLTIGLNCSFGAELLYPYIKRIAECAPCYVSVHPNAGMPNIFGNYTHTPELMCSTIKRFLDEGLLNVLGGCCGSTPEHIKQLKKLSTNYIPRELKNKERDLILTGLEPLIIDENIGFINIGERANVAGSAKFARLIREKQYDEALEIVKTQIEAGANIIDICMDDAMIDSEEQMRQFVNLIQSEPDIAKVPLMIDSSKWETLLVGLQVSQGKSIVNSISLKEGEEAFVEKAMTIQRYGAAVVVMLFDEEGQADTYERKCQIARRSYDLLIENGFPAEDIIFDPNVLTVATGLKEHNTYAIDFIKATRYIKQNLPKAKVSGGISNLSFALSGNNLVREAMHSVFLYHAIKAGLDMAIVNASALIMYEDIDSELLKAVEDVILNRKNDDSLATERLIELATEIKEKTIASKEKGTTSKDEELWRNYPVDERILHSLVRGITSYLETDVLEAYHKYTTAVSVIETCLMRGLQKVGELFADGKMFLPQVVKSARVMKLAVEILQPYMKENTSDNSVGTVVLATVKGDVHDIGKNIVGIVLACNGFKVIDLGVMVAPDKIIEATRKHNPDLVILSGLITPSLDEMRVLIDRFNQENINVDMLVGGATTSKLHTAVKLAPHYNGLVAQTSDASSCATIAASLVGSNREKVITEIKVSQLELQKRYEKEQADRSLLSTSEARENKLQCDFSLKKKPKFIGERIFTDIDVTQIIPFINWTYYLKAWQIAGHIPQILDHPQKGEEARRVYKDALNAIDEIKDEIEINALIGILEAHTTDDDILVITNDNNAHINIPLVRNMDKSHSLNLSLADFIDKTDDYVGLLSLSVHGGREISEKYRSQGDDYKALVVDLVCDRLAEAASEYLHYLIRTELWAYSDEDKDIKRILKGRYDGIRPAFGYSSLPDHRQKKIVFDFFNITEKVGTTLTENYAMLPQSSICSLVFAHKESRYF